MKGILLIFAIILGTSALASLITYIWHGDYNVIKNYVYAAIVGVMVGYIDRLKNKEE